MRNKLEQNISLLQSILVTVVVIFGVSTTAMAAKEITDAVADFSTLNLKVTGVRVVDKIEENDIISGKPRVTWSASGPDNLVVVTLEGVVTAENYYTFTPDGFALFYECQTKRGGRRPSMQDDIKTEQSIRKCRAIRVLTGSMNRWTIQDPKSLLSR
jgi:hypothetical protein